MFNLLTLHRLARQGDGLNPALHLLLSRRAAIEGDPKVTVLHPGRSFDPPVGRNGGAPRSGKGRTGA